MVRIGVISDTHIPDRGAKIPAKIIEEFRKVDIVIHTGDFVQESVLNELKSACKNVVAVWGNMDYPEIKDKLSEKEIVKAGKHRIGVIHGYGAPGQLVKFVTEKFKNDKVDVIIFGHSHAPFNETINGILYFNPGSPTDKIFSPYNSYGIIEANDKIEARIVKL